RRPRDGARHAARSLGAGDGGARAERARGRRGGRREVPARVGAPSAPRLRAPHLARMPSHPYTEATPLFHEELTQTAAQPGAAAARGGATSPGTLAGSLMARRDRLSPAKEVAQRAAVLGREFPYALLAATADLDEAVLRQGLARLVEAEILFVRGVPPAATYTFKHALVQEAAYESLLKRARQQLHARVCDVLGAADGDGAQAQFEVLAHHAERAGRVDEAIDHLERAGFASQHRIAHGEAVRHFERAITLLGTQPESIERDAREARLQYALAFSSVASASYGSAVRRAALERTMVLAERAGNWRTWVVATLLIASSDSGNGHYERARALTE